MRTSTQGCPLLAQQPSPVPSLLRQQDRHAVVWPQLCSVRLPTSRRRSEQFLSRNDIISVCGGHHIASVRSGPICFIADPTNGAQECMEPSIPSHSGDWEALPWSPDHDLCQFLCFAAEFTLVLVQLSLSPSTDLGCVCRCSRNKGEEAHPRSRGHMVSLAKGDPG